MADYWEHMRQTLPEDIASIYSFGSTYILEGEDHTEGVEVTPEECNLAVRKYYRNL